MKKKILIIEKIHEDGLKLLDSRKDIEYELVENCETNYLSEKLKDCDAITLRNIDFNKDVIRKPTGIGQESLEAYFR